MADARGQLIDELGVCMMTRGDQQMRGVSAGRRSVVGPPTRGCRSAMAFCLPADQSFSEYISFTSLLLHDPSSHGRSWHSTTSFFSPKL